MRQLTTLPVIDVVGIMTAVVILVQLTKWAAGDWTRDRELLLVFGISGTVLGLWIVSSGTFTVAALWSYFLAWLTVSAAAAGVYGFVRSGPWTSPNDVPPTIVSKEPLPVEPPPLEPSPPAEPQAAPPLSTHERDIRLAP